MEFDPRAVIHIDSLARNPNHNWIGKDTDGGYKFHLGGLLENEHSSGKEEDGKCGTEQIAKSKDEAPHEVREKFAGKMHLGRSPIVNLDGDSRNFETPGFWGLE